MTRLLGARITGWMVLLAVLHAALATVALAQAPVADLERQARELFDQEKYRESLAVLQTILSRQPDNRTANVLMSYSMARLDMTEPPSTRAGPRPVPEDLKLHVPLAGLLAQQEATRRGAQRYTAVPGTRTTRRPDRPRRGSGCWAGPTSRSPIRALAQRARRPRFEVRSASSTALGDLKRRASSRSRHAPTAPTSTPRALAILADADDQLEAAARYYRGRPVWRPRAPHRGPTSQDRIGEPGFPISLTEMQKTPLDSYIKASAANSKQLRYRMEQLEVTRHRSWARWLPSFFVNPSYGTVSRPAPLTDDHNRNLSFSFGWSLGDLVADPYKINITGMQADLEGVRANLTNEITATYYQRLQNISQYRQLQRALALEPQNAQVRQNKDTIKYNILTLTERLRVYTGIPWAEGRWRADACASPSTRPSSEIVPPGSASTP
jgi:hypothetical protein